MSQKQPSVPMFVVGPMAKRELRRELKRTKNPAKTIENFQQTNSLHTMFAKALGTKPHYDAGMAKRSDDASNTKVESLDTDSVFTFLSHLGVSQREVHKRISDALQKDLEEEIRNSQSKKALLNLLANCWDYTTILPELRPVLWAVLKHLGDQTPHEILLKLAERDANESGKLKHAEIFKPLPGLLKKLVWEADWDQRLPQGGDANPAETNPKQYLEVIRTTLLGETFLPLIQQYCTNTALVEAVAQTFVASARERRVLTTQRRALTSLASSSAKSSVSALANKANRSAVANKGDKNNNEASSQLTTGRSVAKLRHFLNATIGGSASYRPKLLYAVLSMLMAKHGSADSKLTGSHLHCTLVADILLSSGGPLPKAYTDIHSLSRVLDDAVKDGVITDKALLRIQEILRKIFQPDQIDDGNDDDDGDDNNNGAGKGGKRKKGDASDQDDDEFELDDGNKKKKAKTSKPTTFLKRQLNMIITAALTAMKDADPQNLFLNPVTDAIAPGYSDIIKKPMCVMTMEDKVDRSEYDEIAQWEVDVKLMFKNCISYNRGKAGQWFRGEANRQQKVFKDEILPQARKLYKVELAKRNPEEELLLKRKREEAAKADTKPTIAPLPSAHKKQKKDIHDYTPSMPALASMLLADPFVVRLMLDRVLRSLRVDVLKATSVPAAHAVIPSLIQLLHLALFSTHICAARGRKYLVPDSGLMPPSKETVEAMVPFSSVRKYLPVVIHLLLEVELDRRLVAGGALHDVAAVLEDSRPLPPDIASDDDAAAAQTPSQLLQVPVSILQGAFCFACFPGNSQGPSLAVSFVKFANVLQGLARDIRDERAFFLCLVKAILRHKTRLHRQTRDAIVETWMTWLQPPLKKKRKTGSMTCAAHEFVIHLITEWATMGNLIMSRDLLMQTTKTLVETVDATEQNANRKFSAMWSQTEVEDDTGGSEKVRPFVVIKKEYQRMLSILPSEIAEQWKSEVGIAASPQEEEADNAANDAAAGNGKGDDDAARMDVG